MAALDRCSSDDIDDVVRVMGRIQSMKTLRLAFVQPADGVDPTSSLDHPQAGLKSTSRRNSFGERLRW